MNLEIEPPPPEDRPFLDAILARPDDDAPRLVYADRLLERGDLRGELIIAQCTKHPRAAELERAFDDAWSTTFGPDGWRGTNVRGLIERVTNLRGEDVARRFPFLMTHPVRVIGLSDPLFHDLDRLAQLNLRTLRRVRIEMGADYVELDFDECAASCDYLLDTELRAHAWTHPHLIHAVREVCMHRPRIGDDVLMALDYGNLERVEMHTAADEMVAHVRARLAGRSVELVIV